MQHSRYHFAAAFLCVAMLTLGCDDSTGPPDPPGPTTGAIEITAATMGVDLDPAGYDVEVRLQASGSSRHVRVPTNGTATVPGLIPGNYVLGILMVPNCDMVSPTPLTVPVGAGSTTSVVLYVSCVPTQLAFVDGAGSDAEIYVVSSNGTGTSRITTQPGADVNPAWSPDGSRIAFASERDGNSEIYVMSANGTNPQRLTNVAAADYRPAWSPDGARIAFVSERDGNAELYVMNADGTSPMRLTSHSANDGEPAWSPDGSRMAFVTNRDGNAEVYVMGADGSGLSRLTFHDLPDVHPVWSPDGTRIAFSLGASFVSSHIYVMNADGSDIALLTQFVSNGSEPAWSLDGRKIAFTVAYSGFYCYDAYCTYIQIVRTDGTPYSVTTGDSPTEPTWRP
jgi:Tol biopolymer transport system component